MTGPLHGLRVVDCSTDLAGWRAGGILADYGADVLLVEPPGGSPQREWLPIEHAVFNRGKRSVTIDLFDGGGRADLAMVLRDADVLLETCPPAEAERYGLDRDAVRSAAPSLVQCSITAFGHHGSRRDVRGGELIVQALSGVMGEQVGLRDGPIPCAVPFASIGAAYLGVLGTIGAVCRVREDGVGRHVDASLLDGALAYLSMLWGVTDGAPSGPGAGHQHGTIRLVSTTFRCADGEYLGIHTGAVGAFGRFIKVLDLEARIPPITTGVEMGTPLTPQQSKIMIEELPEIIARHPRAYWLERLLAADICAVPHLRSGTVFDEPQAKHNAMSVVVDDPALGPIEQVAPAAKFGRSVPDVPGPAPRPGEHHAGSNDVWRFPRLPVQVSTSEGRTDRPLFDGVRVLDFGAYYAGPYTSRLLGDLGADVIKVEPKAGDQLRGLAKVFRSASSNKRSIAVDLKRPELAAARDGLLEWADVVHHNMRPGAAERLGIGYDEVAARNPRTVYLYAPGWGSSGPDRDRQSFAPMMSGYVGVGLEVAGQHNPPLFPLGNEDPGNALLGAVAIAMALYERQSSGRGQYIENPQLNATMVHLAHVVRRPDGEALGAMRLDPLQYGFGPLQRVYQASDGWVVIDADRRSLTNVGEALGLNRVELATAADDSLADLLAQAISVLPAGQVVERLREQGVSAARPIGYYCDEFVRDPEHLASGRAATGKAEDGSLWRAVGTLLRVEGTTNPPFRMAPSLGAHTDEVLRGLGYDDAALRGLRASGAVR